MKGDEYMASPLFSGRLKKSSIVQVKVVLTLSPLVVLHQLSLSISGAALSPIIRNLSSFFLFSFGGFNEIFNGSVSYLKYYINFLVNYLSNILFILHI